MRRAWASARLNRISAPLHSDKSPRALAPRGAAARPVHPQRRGHSLGVGRWGHLLPWGWARGWHCLGRGWDPQCAGGWAQTGAQNGHRQGHRLSATRSTLPPAHTPCAGPARTPSPEMGLQHPVQALVEGPGGVVSRPVVILPVRVGEEIPRQHGKPGWSHPRHDAHLLV